jgi:hypothetical protein
LLQVCLAAAVANLTLLAATARSALTGSVADWWLVLLALTQTLASLLSAFGLAALLIHGVPQTSRRSRSALDTTVMLEADIASAPNSG